MPGALSPEKSARFAGMTTFSGLVSLEL